MMEPRLMEWVEKAMAYRTFFACSTDPHTVQQAIKALEPIIALKDSAAIADGQRELFFKMLWMDKKSRPRTNAIRNSAVTLLEFIPRNISLAAAAFCLGSHSHNPTSNPGTTHP